MRIQLLELLLERTDIKLKIYFQFQNHSRISRKRIAFEHLDGGLAAC